MTSIDDILKEFQLNNRISEHDIPDLDLYMDQVIQLFDKTFADSKRHGKDKILTKTMINNYAKGGLLPAIKNKKYSKEHIMLLSLIYELKGGLSINDIKETLSGLNEQTQNFSADLSSFYNSYLNLASMNTDRFTKAVQEHVEETGQETGSVNEKHFQHILLILTLTNISNIYRKAAEKLVDGLPDMDKQEKN